MNVLIDRPFSRGWIALALALAANAVAQEMAVPLERVFVTATRASEPIESVFVSNVTLTADQVRAAPNVTVDGALRSVPGFSLFRRSDSLVANPTTQGVSLRGIGPSGASRSLVLLDGVPLNDPFGGWVLWSKVPRESLARIELAPGAGATAWGNSALGGVLQLFTEKPAAERARLALRSGSFNTLDAEAEVAQPVGRSEVQLLGRALSTGGYFVVAPEFRGPIDTRASSRARWIEGRWWAPVTKGTEVTVTLRHFTEARGNGTPYQQNHSSETFASAALTGAFSDALHWNAVAYAQRQSFDSTFSSVNATRTAETPASNQYDVPATAFGAAWTGDWRSSPGVQTTFGLDGRRVRGETREDATWNGTAYTRRRFAGGDQATGGVFAIQRRALTPKLSATVGARVDSWAETNGHRREYLGGALVSDDHYAHREGVAFSPSAGLTWSESEALRIHLNGQHAFRRPTLNELYRPFRVGNVITDGNPALRTETVTSGELGATLKRGNFSFDATGFTNELHDLVANVTVARGPVTLPGIGFVPAGGEGRRKMNLDRVRVKGLSLSADWAATASLSLDARVLVGESEVLGAAVAPRLVGLRLAQVPRTTASAGATWRIDRATVAPRVRFVGDQFEDDQNTLSLAAATIVDLSVSLHVGRDTEVFVNGENLFDHRIETGRSADGLVNIGTPRLLMLGLRWSH
jgi:outer membrane receptor protein involved in Fe transport